MPINKLKTKGTPQDETLFVMKDPGQSYTHSEVCDLLEEAERRGFSLDAGSELEKLTIAQLDVLLHRLQ